MEHALTRTNGHSGMRTLSRVLVLDSIELENKDAHLGLIMILKPVNFRSLVET